MIRIRLMQMVLLPDFWGVCFDQAGGGVNLRRLFLLRWLLHGSFIIPAYVNRRGR